MIEIGLCENKNSFSVGSILRILRNLRIEPFEELVRRTTSHQYLREIIHIHRFFPNSPTLIFQAFTKLRMTAQMFT